MSASTKTFVNGSTPQCEDDDLNGILAENNNLIVDSGQSLNTSDNDQTSKAVSVYAAGADFYTDSGTTTTYVLTAVGSKLIPPAYFDGMRVRFKPANSNVGNATLKVGSLAAVSLRTLDGVLIETGDVISGEVTEATYNNSTGFFEINSIATSKVVVKDQWKFLNGNLLISPDGANVVPQRELGVHSSGSTTALIQITNSASGVTSGDGFQLGFLAGIPVIWCYENLDFAFGANNLQEMYFDVSARGLVVTDGAEAGNGVGTIDAVNGVYVAGNKLRDSTDEKVGSFLTSSIASGIAETVDISHGLGTDDLIVEVAAKGSVDENYHIINKDNVGRYQKHLGVAMTTLVNDSLTTPSAGTLRFKVRNQSGSAQTVNFSYIIRKRVV